MNWTSHVSDDDVSRDEAAPSAPPSFPADRSGPPPPSGFPQRAGFPEGGSFPRAPGVPPPPGWSGSGVPSKDGKLLAAGILGVISGALTLIAALIFLALANDNDAGEWFDDFTDGALTTIGVVLLATGVAYLTAGIGGISNRQWGRITLIVVSGTFLVLILIAVVTGSEATGGIIPLAWCSSIFGLAIASNPSA